MKNLKRVFAATPNVDRNYNRKSRLLGDVSKRCFAIPIVFLKCVNLYPSKQQSNARKLVFFINLSLMTQLQIVQFLYLAKNPITILQFSLVMSTLSTTFQGITKIALIHVNSRRLRFILDEAFFTLWPSNLMGKQLETSLRSSSNLVQLNMVCVTVSAVVFGVGFLLKPLIDGSGELPFATWLPFDWYQPVVYECLYMIQVFTNLYLIILSILGHDFLFLALATNIIAQFRILSKVIDQLGSGKDKEVDLLLSGLEGVHVGMHHDADKQLLGKIIAHHNKLLFICTEMEQIFSPTLFVQLATSMVAICVSSFILTADDKIENNLLYQLISYCAGHVLQLFIICAAGSEIAHQSERFCVNAYTCYWYRDKLSEIRKALVLVILRAQRAVQFTAWGVFQMNYETFISVMRLSFSFYTLLTEIIAKS